MIRHFEMQTSTVSNKYSSFPFPVGTCKPRERPCKVRTARLGVHEAGQEETGRAQQCMPSLADVLLLIMEFNQGQSYMEQTSLRTQTHDGWP